MTRLALVVALLTACGTDGDPIDPAPDAGAEPLQCTSSTLPETNPEWTACRNTDPDSFPVFCEGGAMPRACDFTAEVEGGGTAVCRLPGDCE